MAKDLYVSMKVQNFYGTPLVRGQIVRPIGARNDHLLFGDNTRWTYKFLGSEADLLTCGTDGCSEQFIDDDAMRQHRKLVHAPDRDTREQSRLQSIQRSQDAEKAGETIGGHPVTKVKVGPRGPVPYIDASPVLSR